MIVGIAIISMGGVAYGMSHIDYSDLDWQCKKTIGMWELAKADYPNFVDDTKWLTDKKCGFDVSNLK
ncbi:MAG: hypothetical protein HRU07_06605 [Nitrosopumilus sp.]|nr:hypothetical protein [Nitrosopumilus sp.]NRA05811.1 hypothetical protein [Nitrosopumilus sp.]